MAGNSNSNGNGKSNGDTNKMGVSLFQLTGEKGFLAADAFFTTTFTTLNQSGVTGEAIVGYDVETRTVTVAISAAGLEENQPHIQHIHGFPNGMNATTPTLAQDDDGDGFIEVGEGADTYGPILLNLATNHDNGAGADNGHDHGTFNGFPTAPDGTIWFIEQYQLAATDLLTMASLDLREIVIHALSVQPGIGAGTPGEVNGSGGYEIALPVASGALSQVTSFAEFRSFVDATDFNYDADAAGYGLRGHGMGGDMFFG